MDNLKIDIKFREHNCIVYHVDAMISGGVLGAAKAVISQVIGAERARSGKLIRFGCPHDERG